MATTEDARPVPRCIVCGAALTWRLGKWACTNCGATGC